VLAERLDRRAERREAILGGLLAAGGQRELPAANPFTLAAYDGRLWIANFGGTDVLVVNPARLPGG